MDLSSRAVGTARPVMPTWTPSLKMRFASITSDGGALPAISRSSRTPKAVKENGGAEESLSALAQLDRKNAKLRDVVITLKRQLEAARDGKLRARAQVEGMEGDLLDAKTVILSQQRAHAELKAKYYRVEGAMGALHHEGVLGSAGAATTPLDSPGGLRVTSSASRSRNSSGTEHFKGALAALTSENRKLKSRLQSQRKRERELERRIEQLEKDTRQRNTVTVGDCSDSPGASSDPTLGAVSSAAAALMTDESSPLWTLEPALRAVAIETAMETFTAQQRLKALDDDVALASEAELAAQVRSGAFSLLVKLRKMLTAMQRLVTHQDDLSPAEVVRVMVRALQTLVPSDRSAVWLVDRGRDQMWSIGALDFTYHVALDGGICGDVAQTGNTALVEVAQDDPRFEPAIDDPSAMGQSSGSGGGEASGRAASSVHGEPAVKSVRPFSILAVPLGYLDEPMTHAPVTHGRHSHATHKGVIGVLEIVRDAPGKDEEPRAKAWDDMELALVSIFAEVAGPLLHHAQIAAKTRRCVGFRFVGVSAAVPRCVLPLVTHLPARTYSSASPRALSRSRSPSLCLSPSLSLSLSTRSHSQILGGHGSAAHDAARRRRGSGAARGGAHRRTEQRGALRRRPRRQDGRCREANGNRA